MRTPETAVILTVIVAVSLSLYCSPADAGFIEGGVSICTTPGPQEVRSIVPCPGGGSIVLWQDMSYAEGQFFLQKIDNLGQIQWPEGGVRVSASSCPSSSVAVTSDEAGGIFLAFQYSDSTIHVQHIGADGTHLLTAEGISVCDAHGEKSYPDICGDGWGGVIISWKDDRIGAEGVYAQRIICLDQVVWNPDGVPVDLVNISLGAPRICTDGQGGAIIAWYNEYVWAQRIGPYGLPEWGPGSVRVYDSLTPEDLISAVWIEYDNRYGAIVCWECQIEYTDLWGRFWDFTELVFRAVNSEGAFRYDEKWIYPRDGDYHFNTWSPSFVVNEDGSFWVAWLDDAFIPPPNPTIGLKKYDSSGGTLWGPHACCIYSDSINLGIQQTFPMLAADGADGVHLVWSDWVTPWFEETGESYDWILTSHCDSDGNRSQATRLGPGNSDQGEGVICEDGFGGAIIAWTDYRNGVDEADIYAARIDMSGNVVATLLQSFTASFNSGSVEVSWTLSEAGEGMTFDLYRAEGPSASFCPVQEPRIVRDGMVFSYTDRDVDPGCEYRYRVDVSDDEGRRVLFETGPVETAPVPLALYQNRPNPFNPVTEISYSLPGTCRVKLEIFDVSGRSMAVLVNAVQKGGAYNVRWDGLLSDGVQASSGIYFYRLTAGKQAISRKMVLLR